MSRKVFISFLGATNYGECEYLCEGKSYGRTRFIQETTIRHLMSKEEWLPTDAAYILMTVTSETNNWVDFHFNNRDTGEPLTGLHSSLEKLSLPFPVHTIRELPDGNNEKEIWEIFQRVFNECIQEGDELYFDITHGYRYLPMLTIVLGNYSKFLRNVTVKSITYGNYEISEHGAKPGLIVDITPLSSLQDWTYAAGQFIHSGDASRLEKIGTETLQLLKDKEKNRTPNIDNLRKYIKYLNLITEDIRTCRGSDIIEAKKIKQINELSTSLNASIIPPLEPVIKKTQLSLTPFKSKENVINGFLAAKWCYEHGLYQQSATILQESIVTYFCKELNIDWKTEKERKPISFALGQRKDDTSIPTTLLEKENIILLTRSHRLFGTIRDTYRALTDLRNDFNHAGMRPGPCKSGIIVKNLNSYIQDVLAIFKDYVD